MIKTLNPYPNPAKTAEIMSRYRPIAPKPETTSSNSMNESSSSSLSQKIKQSPYLRNLWPQLQARPTRTRKRGRAPLTLPSSSLKRHKTHHHHHHVLGFCPPCHVTPPSKNLSLQGFPHPNHALGVLNCTIEKNTTNIPSLVTLPLLPCSPGPSPKLDSTLTNPCEVLDLNTKMNVPEEKDLLQQLQKPVSNTTTTNNNINLVTPQPLRPVGSSITVVCISGDSTLAPPLPQTPKTPHEVEQEAEHEPLPVVISDSNHRIRMANSAYKEMVGQPVCPWLESVVVKGSFQCKRICGEVTLRLGNSNLNLIPTSSKGFSCWVRIEWQGELNNKKNCVNAFCDVVKLACESRDYLFTWRFHTRTREPSQSSCCNASN